MDRRCSVEACKREAETHCYHCSRDVCTTHYLEHKKSIQEQLPSFVDEVNVIYERLRRSDKNGATPAPSCLVNVYNQLDQWRAHCHQHIDTVYQGVRNQIQSIAESHKHEETQKAVGILESLEKMREKLKGLLKEEDVTYRQLETMKKQLEEIKKKEQEPINYPDIRIITEKINVEKHARVTVESKNPIDGQRILERNSKKFPFKVTLDQASSILSFPSEELRLSPSLSGQINNKCPICYMIFPPYMTETDRNQHVETHF